ncbi:MAG: hypoxanthine phosphoribosyltransferase [Alphaproteobacteria bacterium]
MSRPAARVEVLYSAAAIASRVAELAEAIAADDGAEPTIVSVLKGSFVFSADLMRALHGRGVHPRIDFMMLSSYGTGTESSGQVQVLRDITDDVRGRPVLLVDDILESGRTLAFARQRLLEHGAARVELCVLLEKPGKRKAEINARYVGFRTPDLFVVGYGLDYAHYYRELPYIGVVQQDDDAGGG